MRGALRASLLRWAPLLFALCVVGAHLAPIWRDLSGPGTFDTRWAWFMVGVDRTTIIEHGQFPLWNPYYCGGAPHLASPQSGTLSPLTLPILLFGTPIGYRLGYTIGLLGALFCLRAFCRTLGLGELAGTVAGAGYAVCGAFAQHLGGGHWGWISFAFYPLMLRSLHRVLAGRWDHVVWGALPLTMIIFHWPVYPMAYALVVLGLYALFIGLQNGPRDLRRLGTALLAAGGMIGLGLAMAAIRLVPVSEYIAAHPRKVKDRDYTWPWELFETFAGRHTARGFGNHQYVFPEYGNYLGAIGLALMFAGLYLVLRRRRALLPIAVSAGTFLLFQLGNLIPLPWWLLKKLPVYQNLRVPSRFTIIAGLFMCVLIGVAVDTWAAPVLAQWRSAERRARRIAVLVLVLSGAFLVDAVSFNILQWNQSFGTPPATDPKAAEFHQATGNPSRMYVYPGANQGSLRCFEETPIPISDRLRVSPPAEEFLQEPDAGTVRRLRWSPNRIELDVELRRPATVVINQNFGPGWRVSEGTVTNEGGLLAARVEQGNHRVTFRYLPRAVLVGGTISLVAVGGAAIFLVAVFRRRRRRAGG